jgi:hypothetical protein
MSVRQDKVQINIEFLTDESKAFARTIQDTKNFQEELRKAQKDGGNVNAVIQKIIDSGKSLAGLDLKNVMPAQLTQRAEQLKAALRFIPEMHPARVQMEKELQDINTRLGEMSSRSRAVKKAMDDVKPSASGLSGIFQTMFSVFLGGGLLNAVQGVFGSIFGYLKESVTSYGAAAQADGQLRASLKSTNEVAGKSFDDLTKAATALSKVTLFDDDAIKGSQALLLTFTNIRGKVYDDAMPAILDMSQALGQDLKSSSIQLGKALNDPIQGVSALSKVGVSFNESQKETIKTLVETNRVAEAQALILKELETEFGGSAKAAAEAGMGPYMLIQKRFGEIQESVGMLMERGLRPFAPILGNITTFFEKLTDVMVTGEAAQGEFSTAVNVASTVLKAIGNVIYIVYKGVELAVGIWWEWQKVLITSAGYIVDFIKKAENFPIIGTLIKSITDPLRLVGDLLTNASATFEGFRAAAQQAIENVKNYFLNFAATAEIFGLKIAKALSFDDARNAAIEQQINALEAAKVKFASAGKSVGDAYSEARNNAIKNANAEAEKQETAEAQRRAKSAPLSIGGMDAEDLKKKQKEFSKQVKEGFDVQLKETELFWERERLANEIAFIKKQRTEDEFYQQDHVLQVEKYDGLIAIQTKYLGRLKEGTIEYLELEKKILDLEKKRIEAAAEIAPRKSVEVTQTLTTKKVTSVSQSETGDALGNIQAKADLEMAFVRDKFKNLLTLEIEFEIQRQKIQQKAFNDQLQRLKDKGLEETSEYKRIAHEKIALDKSIFEHEKLLDEQRNEKSNIKKQLQKDTFNLAISLLHDDLESEKSAYKQKSDAIEERMKQFKTAKQQESAEYKKLQKDKEAVDKQELAARQKTGAAIKAFQTAQIVIDGIAEVQGIWKTANLNALNILFPGAGEIIAGVKTALSIGRSASAINRVNATKFASGGMAALKQGIFGGKPHSAGGTKGFFEDGTSVEVEKDEAFVVVNKNNTPLLRQLSNVNSYGGNGRPFFADGGVLNLNTTPTGFNNATAPSVSVNLNLDALINEVRLMRNDLQKTETNRKAYVVVDEFEAKQKSVNQDRSDAAY